MLGPHILCLLLLVLSGEGFESSIFKSNSLIFYPSQQGRPSSDPGHHWRSKRSINVDDEHQSQEKKKLHRLAHNVKVESDIRYRYAITLISDKVHNTRNFSREVYLTLILPETAFISRFAIEVGGQLFVAFVKEKEAAWATYQEAVDAGKTAGHVGVSGRHANNFRVSVNTEAHSTVTFYLLYEELLQRRQGFYHHVINITPRQRLESFSITMRINEQRNITFVQVPKLRKHDVEISNALTGNDTEIQRISPREVKIHYRPHLPSLQALLKSSHALQFAVNYDVDRPDDGEVLVVDGYFVHFIAPENIPPLPKHVIFVLDTSGSMSGKKMIQTKDAMRTILTDLSEQDYITLIDFDHDVNVWNHYHDYYVQMSESIREEAMAYVDSMEAEGGTNINDALINALQMVKFRTEEMGDKRVQSMILFLTDGNPTEGVTNTTEILDNILNDNIYEVPIFALAFGRGADYDMLKVLSLRNFGFARKIYVAADASLQLEGFYREISSPILRNVRFVYQNDSISQNSLTSTQFHSYYKGSEMVVAGNVMTPGQNEQLEAQIEYKIFANDLNGEYELDGRYMYNTAPVVETETILLDFVVNNNTIHSNILERLWAYLTIQDLFKAIARGEFSSCPTPTGASAAKRSIQEKNEEANGGSTFSETDIEKILEKVGDQDIYICDHLEYALYLSLKYEFVTPLTSLVIVKPDEQQSPQKSPGEDNEDEYMGSPPHISIIGNGGQPSALSGSILPLILVALRFI